ncbi:hypothetical protein, partial [Enterococcus casseliflavus]|uniref:hypothetical protein n=1 Tax=Enterococcus casseliflavus TaxID=37734 RepID=UPI003D0CC979
IENSDHGITSTKAKPERYRSPVTGVRKIRPQAALHYNSRSLASRLPMRLSRFALSTSKETPADAAIVSHQLMLRGGFIRQLGSGLYSWMPIGVRV